MSNPANKFLPLIPTAHRVAIISPFTASEESLIPALQKTRRSSSTATTESNSAEEPALPSETADIVESPTDAEKPVASGFTFLRLGN